MKLLSRLYRIHLGITVSTLLLAGTAFYFLSSYLIIQQFDDAVIAQRIKIEKYVAQHQKLPVIIPVRDQVITFTPADAYQKEQVVTEFTPDPLGNDTSDFRKHYFSVKAGNQWYRVLVGRSMERTENLHQTISAIIAGSILLLVLASFAINRIFLKNIWSPFYKSLQQLRQFHLGQREPPHFPDSNIEEFRFMNTVLRSATQQVDKDYQILKEFTENASHEMQTPLAILRSKLDLVLQDETVSAHHEASLVAMYKAIQKLKNLNKSLLLLTKIGNNQFAEKTSIQLNTLVQEKIDHFQEMAQNKDLQLTSTIHPCEVTMNRELADNLLNNLVSNAIKHNRHAGKIHISLNVQRQLTIKNTGINGALDRKKIFTRFYKTDNSSEFTGLGLSIIQQICHISQCHVQYDFQQGEHLFQVKWPDKTTTT